MSNNLYYFLIFTFPRFFTFSLILSFQKNLNSILYLYFFLWFLLFTRFFTFLYNLYFFQLSLLFLESIFLPKILNIFYINNFFLEPLLFPSIYISSYDLFFLHRIHISSNCLYFCLKSIFLQTIFIFFGNVYWFQKSLHSSLNPYFFQ